MLVLDASQSVMPAPLGATPDTTQFPYWSVVYPVGHVPTDPLGAPGAMQLPLVVITYPVAQVFAGTVGAGEIGELSGSTIA